MSESGFKKYVLADVVKSTAQIFLGDKDTDKAFRLDTPRKVNLYLRHRFADKSGKRKITRYKLGANSIDQSEQIKNDMIPANEAFTVDERGALQIVNGVLIVDEADEFTTEFLSADNNPQRVEFTGRDRGGVSGILMELDEEKMADEENDFIFKTADAIQKIKGMSEDELGAYISLVFGASFTPPSRLKDKQNLLVKSLEGSEERVNLILDSKLNQDDEVTILLSKAINQGVVSFEIKPNYVSVKRGSEWADAKMIVADSYEEREILFRQHLATTEGELLKKDIEKLVNGDGGKATKAKNK